MKKTLILTKLLSCILISAMLLPCLYSCQKDRSEDKEKAEVTQAETPSDTNDDDLLQLSDMSNMEKLEHLCALTEEHFSKNLQIDLSIDSKITGEIMGLNAEIDLSVSEKQIKLGIGTSSYSYSSVAENFAKTTITNSGRETTDHFIESEGYVDGNMFYSNVPVNDEVSGVYYKSPCSLEDYLSLSDSDSDGDDFIESFGKNATAELNPKNREWVFTLSQDKSGDTASTLDIIEEIMGSNDMSEINSLSIELIFDAKSGIAKAINMSLDAYTEENNGVVLNAIISLRGSFSFPEDSTDLTPEYFHTYSTDIDLLHKEIAFNTVEDLFESDNQSFHIVYAQNIYLQEDSEEDPIWAYIEEDDFNYGVKDGVFKFDIRGISQSTDGDEIKSKIKYDGKYYTKVSEGKQAQKRAMNENTARDRLISMINCFEMDDEDIKGLEFQKLDNGNSSICINLGMNDAAEDIISGMDIEIDNVDEYINCVQLDFDENMNLINAYYWLRVYFRDYIMGTGVIISDIEEADFSLFN